MSNEEAKEVFGLQRVGDEVLSDLVHEAWGKQRGALEHWPDEAKVAFMELARRSGHMN